VAAYGLFTVLCAGSLFAIIKATMGLRVSEEEEIEGLDYGEHGMHAYDTHLGGGVMDELPAAARMSVGATALAATD
jgi:Amt family ammonium transporter